MTDTRTIGHWVHPSRQPAQVLVSQTSLYDNTPRQSGLAPLYFVQPTAGGVRLMPMNDSMKAGNGWRLRGGASPYDLSFGNFLRQMPHELQDNPFDRVLAYKAAVWAGICVRRRSEALAGIPRLMRDKTNDKPVYNHLLLTAIDNAYAQFDQRFMMVYETSLCLHGEAFVEPVNNGYVFNALHLLNPLGVAINMQSGYVMSYTYMGAMGGGVTYTPDELMMDKLYDPSSDIRGDSLMGAALDSVNVSRDMRLYTKGFFRADGMPAGIITARQGFAPTKEEADAFIARWDADAKEQGVASKYDVKFIPGAFEFEQLQREPVPEDIKLSEQAQEEICAVFQVPRAIAGAVVDANYQTSEQRLDWHENVITNLAAARAEFINLRIKPLFDPENRFTFEFDIDAMLDKLGRRQRQHEIISNRYKGGEITLNEARKAMGDEPFPGGDFLLLPGGMTPVPVAKLATVDQTAQPATVDNAIQQTVQNAVSAAIPAVPTVKNPLQVNPGGIATKGDGVPGVTAILKPDAETIKRIQAVQDALRAELDSEAIQWTPPEQFHVTLVHAPLMSDEALDYAKPRVLPFHAFLSISQPLSVFANEKTALIIPVQHTQELDGYQRDLYHMAFEQEGVVLSGHSNPDDWTPHITLGYAPAGTSIPESVMTAIQTFPLTFNAVDLTRTDYTSLYSQAADTETADTELTKWWHKAKKAVKTKGIKAAAVPFTVRYIRSDIAEALQATLATVADDAALKLAFDRARELVAYKSIQATRLKFEADFDQILHDAMNKRIDRRTFSNKLRTMIRNYGQDAYRDGLTDGGLEALGFDDDDLATINQLVAQQTAYVSDFGDLLFNGDGISQTQADSKASTWYNKSIAPFYSAGVGSADRNGLYEWAYGRTEKHCDSCKRLNGQKHRMKDWLKHNLLPKSDRLSCGGFQCDCSLNKTNGRARGRF